MGINPKNNVEDDVQTFQNYPKGINCNKRELL